MGRWGGSYEGAQLFDVSVFEEVILQPFLEVFGLLALWVPSKVRFEQHEDCVVVPSLVRHQREN